MSNLPSSFLPKFSRFAIPSHDAELSEAVHALRTWRNYKQSEHDALELDYARTWLKKLLKTTSSEDLLDAGANTLAEIDGPRGASEGSRYITLAVADRQLYNSIEERKIPVIPKRQSGYQYTPRRDRHARCRCHRLLHLELSRRTCKTRVPRPSIALAHFVV